MELFPEHLDDAARPVDFTRLDEAELEVEDQDHEHRQGQGETIFPEPAVTAAPTENVQQENQQHADSHHLQLVGHDADAVHARLEREERGGREHGDDGNEHQEEGDDQNHLVSPEGVHPVPDVPSLPFFLFLLTHLSSFRITGPARPP